MEEDLVFSWGQGPARIKKEGFFWEEGKIHYITGRVFRKAAMFGYIRPLKDELKIREYRLYRSYYCGYCKYLAKGGGFIPRLLLSHDLVFLNLLLSSLQGKEEQAVCRCLLHPFRFSVIKDESLFASTVPINLLLLHHKLKDDLQEGWSLGKQLLFFLLRGRVGKIRSYRGDLVFVVEEDLNRLKEQEVLEVTDLDQCCEPFAHLLGYLFCQAVPQGGSRRILEWMGFNLGKWIYLLDAYDDLAEDKKKGSYNPLFSAFSYQGGNLDDFRGAIRGRVASLLRYSHHQLVQSFQLLPLKKNQGLLENILYLGLPQQMEEIVFGGGCQCGKGSLSGPWYRKRCL